MPGYVYPLLLLLMLVAVAAAGFNVDRWRCHGAEGALRKHWRVLPLVSAIAIALAMTSDHEMHQLLGVMIVVSSFLCFI